jgi:hypothetical protein
MIRISGLNKKGIKMKFIRGMNHSNSLHRLILEGEDIRLKIDGDYYVLSCYDVYYVSGKLGKDMVNFEGGYFNGLFNI